MKHNFVKSLSVAVGSYCNLCLIQHDKWLGLGSPNDCPGLTIYVEKSGGKVDYYRVNIETPNQAMAEYTAECSDIIEALGMTFNEGELFKSLWRMAAQRTLGKGKEGNTALRDAEKIAHYGERILLLERAKNGA